MLHVFETGPCQWRPPTTIWPRPWPPSSRQPIRLSGRGSARWHCWNESGDSGYLALFSERIEWVYAPLFPRPLDPRAVLPSLVASPEHGAGWSPLPACLAFLCCLLTADTAGLTAACLEVSVVCWLLFIGLLGCLSSGLAPVSVCLHVLALCLCVLPASCLSVWLLQCQFVTGLRSSWVFSGFVGGCFLLACRLLPSVSPGFMCRFFCCRCVL
jgi:hypothetical protein